MKQIILNIVLVSLCFTSVTAQYKTTPIDPKVKTLQVYRKGENLSYPVISLNQTGGAIAINFDILSPEMNQITYSIIHCEADWSPSDLSVNEYINGFQENYVANYEYSQSTNIDYVHYELLLPNDDVQLRLTGNYAVIMQDEDTGDTLLTACFYVVEQKVTITGKLGGASHVGQSGKSQQVNFTVSHPTYNIDQPISETRVVVQQNNTRLNESMDNTPTYIRDKELIYDQHPKFSFDGGGEYRTFETVAKHYTGIGVKNVSYYKPYYHFTLNPSDMRGVRQYEYDDDINGKYVIRSQDIDEDYSSSETDYVVVHFNIPMKDPVLDGKIYFNGAFTYDELSQQTKMEYNVDRASYEGEIMLKQGYYNFRYYTVSTWDKELKSGPMEMDAYQTENDYQIFFYHKAMGERYERLIGYQIVNTIE